MRPTNLIDDPKLEDIEDRDAVIRKLCNIVRGQLEYPIQKRSDYAMDMACESALVLIGDLTSIKR